MLQSSRLIISPLTADELCIYLESPSSLAQTYGLHDSESVLDNEIRDTIKSCLLPNIDRSEREFLFYTLWLVIEKTTKNIVGNICFHGEPVNRKVEIGYETNLNFRNRGYISEAIGIITEWATKRQDIDFLVAETKSDNIPSQKVLAKNGFYQLDEHNSLISWEKSVKA